MWREDKCFLRENHTLSKERYLRKSWQKNSKFDKKKKNLLTPPRSSANQKQDKYKEKHHTEKSREILQSSRGKKDTSQPRKQGSSSDTMKATTQWMTFSKTNTKEIKWSSQISVFSKNILWVK